MNGHWGEIICLIYSSTAYNYATYFGYFTKAVYWFKEDNVFTTLCFKLNPSCVNIKKSS